MIRLDGCDDDPRFADWVAPDRVPADLEARAAACGAEYLRLEAGPGWTTRHRSTFAWLLYSSQELRAQAASARLAAEALPHDPEAP